MCIIFTTYLKIVILMFFMVTLIIINICHNTHSVDKSKLSIANIVWASLFLSQSSSFCHLYILGRWLSTTSCSFLYLRQRKLVHEWLAKLLNFRLRDSVVQMQSLLLCLPSLRAADAALRRYWLSVRHQGSVHMNKLFVEMLESHMRWMGTMK